MAIPGIEQPEVLAIDDTLQLRKLTESFDFALEWYQDAQTLLLVDGENRPYDRARLARMYHYLADHGECYIIEARNTSREAFAPIGDVTFWQEDMPIVIGRPEWRGRGIGSRVVCALVERGRKLHFPYLEVGEIYDYNLGSRKLFERAGFCQADKTERGHRFRMNLQEGTEP